MAGKSDYLEAVLLDLVFKNVAFTELATVWVALHNTVTDDADGGVEVTGTAYARVAVTSANWTRTANAVDNDILINFGTVGAGAWGTLNGFGIYDAVTNGNLLYWGTLAGIVTAEFDNVQFDPGALDMTED